jgi:hypothetical protein
VTNMLEMEHTDILTCPFQLAERDANELLVAADMFGGCREECRRWTPTSIGRENLSMFALVVQQPQR